MCQCFSVSVCQSVSVQAGELFGLLVIGYWLLIDDWLVTGKLLVGYLVIGGTFFFF